MQCYTLSLHHHHEWLRSCHHGCCWDQRSTLNNHFHIGLRESIRVLSCAHISAAVLWTCDQNLEENGRISGEVNVKHVFCNSHWCCFKEYLQESIRFHGQRTFQHGFAVVVQPVPRDRRVRFPPCLTLQGNRVSHPDLHRSNRGDGDHRRHWKHTLML